jgi:hypothetical protein
MHIYEMEYIHVYVVISMVRGLKAGALKNYYKNICVLISWSRMFILYPLRYLHMLI